MLLMRSFIYVPPIIFSNANKIRLFLQIHMCSDTHILLSSYKSSVFALRMSYKGKDTWWPIGRHFVSDIHLSSCSNLHGSATRGAYLESGQLKKTSSLNDIVMLSTKTRHEDRIVTFHAYIYQK